MTAEQSGLQDSGPQIEQWSRSMLKSHVSDGLVESLSKLFFTVKDRRSKLYLVLCSILYL